MIAVLVVLGLVLFLGGALGLVVFAGYSLRDIAVLTFLGFITLYVSRFDLWFSTEIAGRPFVGLHWFLFATVLMLVPLRFLSRQRPSLQLAVPGALLGAFAGLALLSGVLHRGGPGLVASIQVMMITLLPILVALQTVDLMPRTRTHSNRLRFWLILVGGVITPFLLVSSAVAPNLYGSILGWSMLTAERTSGFVRGWSPLGSPISTGTIMVLAYGLAMHEVIGRRKHRYMIVLLLIAVGILFTLSRSVVAMLILFHIAYFWSTIRRHMVGIATVSLVAFFVFIPLVWMLQGSYSFERFLSVSDSSLDLRSSSATAALGLSLKQPILGQGPGLVYEELRTDWLRGGKKLRKMTVIAGQYSAMEPHNMYLLIAVEHGWFALLAFCGLLAVLWKRVRIRKYLALEEDRSAGSAFSALWLALLAMLLTYSGPLVNPQASVLIWFFAFAGLHWRETVLLESLERDSYLAPMPVRERILAPASVSS